MIRVLCQRSGFPTSQSRPCLVPTDSLNTEARPLTSPLSTAVIHSHCHLIRHYQSITDVGAWNQRLILCQPIAEQNPLAISVLRCAPANQWLLPITNHTVKDASYEFKCGRYFQKDKNLVQTTSTRLVVIKTVRCLANTELLVCHFGPELDIC